MPNQVAVFDPLASPSGSFNTQLPRGAGTIHIINDSHVTLNFSINGFASMVTVVPAGATVNIPMCPPYNTVYWATAAKLVTSTKVISSRVVVMAYGSGEPVPAEKATSRQVNPTTIGFGVMMVQAVSAAGDWLELSVFNTAGNTVNGTFYEATYTSNDGTTFPRVRFTNVDPLLSGIGVLAFSRDIRNTVPTQMNCTAQGNLVAESFPNNAGDIALAGGNSYNFIPSPDQIFVPPGNGLVFASQIAATTSRTQMTFKWTETAI